MKRVISICAFILFATFILTSCSGNNTGTPTNSPGAAQASDAMPALTTSPPPVVISTPKNTRTAIPNVTEAASAPIIYSNKNLGFTLTLPSDWKDKYAVYESDTSVVFYSKKIKENYPVYKGWIFSIKRVTGELLTKEYIEENFAKATLAAQGNGYTYIAQFPTDVEYPLEENKELSDEYVDMENEVNGIYQSITFLKIDPSAVLN